MLFTPCVRKNFIAEKISENVEIFLSSYIPRPPNTNSERLKTMTTATWYFEKQPDGGFLMWHEDDPKRPLPARNLAELRQQCQLNSIFEEPFADICRQLEKGCKATVTVPIPGLFSIG
jgi:hypothetical protein